MTLATVSAIISAIIAAIVSVAVCVFTLRSQRRSRIYDLIDKVIGISIDYPYLEDDNFCKAWKEIDKTTEEAMRYENYCCLVFNLLEHLWSFNNGNESKIAKMFYASEMIRRHKVWWKLDLDNIYGYDPAFRQYVAKFLS
ncbi:MAG: hypothetical protein ACLP5H_10045 [Desulfomonilaceae bacterium]